MECGVGGENTHKQTKKYIQNDMERTEQEREQKKHSAKENRRDQIRRNETSEIKILK